MIVAAVSSAEQASEEKDSIPGQLAACRQTCQQRGWTVVDEIAIPGHSRNYNWLHEIIRDCEGCGRWVQLVESDTVDLVVCRDYDRLWRTDALRAQITALCREHRTQVFSLNQPVEPVRPDLLASGSDSHLVMEAMSGIISEMENRARTRRMMAGKRARIIKRGLAVFAGSVPYGYKRGLDGNFELVPEELHWLRWIFERRAHDHWGYKRIAHKLTRLGVLSARSVATAQAGHTFTPRYLAQEHDSGIPAQHVLHRPRALGRCLQRERQAPPRHR